MTLRLHCEVEPRVLDLVGYYGKIKVKDDWTLLALSKWMNGDAFYRDEKDVRASLDRRKDQEFQQYKECVAGKSSLVFW